MDVKLLRRSEMEWEVPVGHIPGMRVPGRIFLSDMLKKTLEEGAVTQCANVATMPGIVKASFAMPDIHWGYGFPIGGVAAFDLDEGVISPGGVGFDINCGVRLMATPLRREDIGSVPDLLEHLYESVPTGMGRRSMMKVSSQNLNDIMQRGSGWAVSEGYGTERDLTCCEENGGMRGADPEHVSDKARKRGLPQSGTLGSGNHFLEIQEVSGITDEDAARVYGISEGQICVMIHCGSRGLGHQVCTDHLRTLEAATKKYNISLPDRQLACAPLSSAEGQAYFGAMAAAANYAWTNRQMIMHRTREVFMKIYDVEYDEMPLVYDVAHNVAKIEEHSIGNTRKKLCVHRKGATRAFGPGSPDLPGIYSRCGQPVIIPGSMGTSSYLLKGTTHSMETAFGSTCHGAGRVLSRSKAVKQLQAEDVKQSLLQKGIHIRAASESAIAEEAPEAYKSINEVVRIVDSIGISKIVARLKPLGVIKG